MKSLFTFKQNIFSFLNGIISAIFISFIVNYIYFNFNETTLKTIELIGILGGLFSLYFKFQTYLGKCILSVLFFIKKRRYIAYQNQGIEMTSLKHTYSQVNFNDLESNDTFLKLSYHEKCNNADYNISNIWLSKRPKDVELINDVISDNSILDSINNPLLTNRSNESLISLYSKNTIDFFENMIL